MNLKSELKARIAEYLAGQISLADLRDWLDEHTQEIADEHDLALDRLAGRVELLAAELDLGHRTEQGVRNELSVLVTKLYLSTPDGVMVYDVETGWSRAA